MRVAKLKRSALNAVRQFSQSAYGKARYPLGIAFDIDGVLLRGGMAIEGASQAVRQLYADINKPCKPQIPHIFLTNGGGMPESVKALELSTLLGVKVLPEQVFLGHTPFKGLKSRFGNSHILAVGKGQPSQVMTSYGFRSVVSMEDFVPMFKDIDPLAKYKSWSVNGKTAKVVCSSSMEPCIKAVDAIFIVSDPVDWGRDIQVLCDALRSGGLPGRKHGEQPPLYFAADDFEYQAAFPIERLGMGAFRIALEAIYNRISTIPLVYTSFGKPQVQVFRCAEIALLKIAQMMQPQIQFVDFERLYMIGDNPCIDILGAKQAGAPWFSILTRTGCFKGSDNDVLHPADLVVDNVLEAVQFILREHGLEKSWHSN